MVEPVELERLRRDAICVIIRLGLGGYDLQGTAGNILVPESYVAWATVKSELGNEGYSLVTAEEYAAARGLGITEVLTQVHDKREPLRAGLWGLRRGAVAGERGGPGGYRGENGEGIRPTGAGRVQ